MTGLPLSRSQRGRSRLAARWRQAGATSRHLLLVGAVVTAGFAVVALLAPVLAPHGQAAHDAPSWPTPSLSHPFGTTNLRFDVLSRVIFGARLAFEVVLASTAFALVIGVPLGLVSGYTGRRLDRVLVLVMDALYAFPSLLLAIVAAFALQRWVGPGVPAAALSISVIYIPQYFRVVRNHTLAVREEPFVDAARAMGAPPRVIIVRYVAANVLQSVPVIFTVNAADAVLTLAGLGFLGYGVYLRTAEWGFDIGNAISDVGTGAWWTSLFPGLGIVGLVTGMSLLGEGINDVLNPGSAGAGIGAGRPGPLVDPEDPGAGRRGRRGPPGAPADRRSRRPARRSPPRAPARPPAVAGRVAARAARRRRGRHRGRHRRPPPDAAAPRPRSRRRSGLVVPAPPPDPGPPALAVDGLSR